MHCSQSKDTQSRLQCVRRNGAFFIAESRTRLWLVKLARRHSQGLMRSGYSHRYLTEILSKYTSPSNFLVCVHVLGLRTEVEIFLFQFSFFSSSALYSILRAIWSWRRQRIHPLLETWSKTISSRAMTPRRHHQGEVHSCSCLAFFRSQVLKSDAAFHSFCAQRRYEVVRCKWQKTCTTRTVWRETFYVAVH